MRRRAFLCGAVLAARTAFGRARPGAGAGRIAVTMDDPHTGPTALLDAATRDACIRDALRGRGLRAVLFVCGKRVDDAAGAALLSAWEADGHALGNHSRSHESLNARATTVERFTADILAGEEVLAPRRGFARLFRFPFLKEGDTAEKRDAVRAFLRARGYANGHVTVDASDWYVDQRLRKRLEVDPRTDIAPYRAYYVEHILDRARTYDALARKALGRTVPHTLLVHHNLLNALFLGDLLDALAADGFELVDALDAYADPVFAREPDVLPAGESILWALAKEAGVEGLRYPAEDGGYEAGAMDARGL